ncbi:MAG: hypothetical protein ACOCV8_05710, partial [Spirochaetota bacterium]
IPSIFFTQYENRKVNRYITGTELKNNDTGSPYGIYAEIEKTFIPDRLAFIISFEDYFDDDIEGEAYLRIYYKEIVRGLGIEVLIHKWDMSYDTAGKFFSETFDKTMWFFKFYWWLTPNARFSITAQNYFLLTYDEGIIKQHTFSLETLIYIP